MSDAARLCRVAFQAKASGTPYANFRLPQKTLDSIEVCRSNAVLESAYAAAISYNEALAGFPRHSTSWSVVKLYYSCFYSVRALILMNYAVPFNGGSEMILDISTGNFLKGGRSSHDWNWNSLRKTSARLSWFVSQDSQDAYEKIKAFRENVNYTHGFRDPELPPCLVSPNPDVLRRFRTYRDDVQFFYTYLPEHLAMAYPTRMLAEVDAQVRANGLALSIAQRSQLASIWKFKERCPLT